MATMMKTPEYELHDYISEISERADVRVGSPLPLETQEMGGGVNFAIFSRYAGRVRLEFFDHPVDTSRSAPQDLSAAEEETLLGNSTAYRVEARSSVILLTRKQESALGGGSV